MGVKVSKELQEALLDEVEQARHDLEFARQRYTNAVLACRGKVPNTRVARVVGISETAIRNYGKRHADD